MKTLNEKIKPNNCTKKEINFVVIYHDVNDQPEGFKTLEEAENWKKDEIKFGDYDMSILTFDEFNKR